MCPSQRIILGSPWLYVLLRAVLSSVTLLKWYLMDFSFFPFSNPIINKYLEEMLWNCKYPDRGNLIQGVGYSDDKRAHKLNNPEMSNSRKPSPPPDLRHKGRGNGVAGTRVQGHAQKACLVRTGAMKETTSLLVMPPEAEKKRRKTARASPLFTFSHWLNPANAGAWESQSAGVSPSPKPSRDGQSGWEGWDSPRTSTLSNSHSPHVAL